MQTSILRAISLVATTTWGAHAWTIRPVVYPCAKVLRSVSSHTTGFSEPSVQASVPSRMMSSSSPPDLTWCRTASLHPDGDVLVKAPNVSSTAPEIAGRTFDLTQSADWMESLEVVEGRQDDKGGAGAYDTLRCDILLAESSDRKRMWGQDFHLDRLRKSYLSLYDPEEDPTVVVPSEEELDLAMEQSRQILDKLVSEAQDATLVCLSNSDDILINLYRVTVLWSKAKDMLQNGNKSSQPSIVVRGHATGSRKNMKVGGQPDIIQVSVAAHSSDAASGQDESLPTRHANPQSKVASWCRMRKQMERPDTYKPPGVSEVLLVRPRTDDEGNPRMEVLEGLSSNLFVVYDDGTLRTATEGILHGYVRHLVLNCAEKVGLRFLGQPVYLDEVKHWKEAFITSSSRLIYPISKVLIPPSDDTTTLSHHDRPMVEYWAATPDETPKWQELRAELLREGGYEKV